MSNFWAKQARALEADIKAREVMGKHTTYNTPSGTKIEISMEDILRRTRTTPFWRRTVPAWQAGLFLAVLAGLFTLTFWSLAEDVDNPRSTETNSL